MRVSCTYVGERAAVLQEVLNIDGGEDRFLRARCMQDGEPAGNDPCQRLQDRVSDVYIVIRLACLPLSKAFRRLSFVALCACALFSKRGKV